MLSGSMRKPVKMEHRTLLQPLLHVLNRRLEYTTVEAIAQQGGPAPNRATRILAYTTSSPNYVDMVKLATVAGLTPNAAAKLVGLYHGPDDRVLTDEEQQLLDTFNEPSLTSEQRAALVKFLGTMVDSFRGVAATTPASPRGRVTARAS